MYGEHFFFYILQFINFVWECLQYNWIPLFSGIEIVLFVLCATNKTYNVVKQKMFLFRDAKNHDYKNSKHYLLSRFKTQNITTTNLVKYAEEFR